MRTAVLFITCIVAGVAAAKTFDVIEDSRRKALLLARVETNLELVQARRKVAEEMRRRVEERVKAAVVSPRDLAEAAFQSGLLEYEEEKIRLDLEEVRLSGREPRDELCAPLQGGRDFVTERLRIEHKVSSAKRERLGERSARVRKLAEDGLVHQSEMTRLEGDLAKIDAELEDIQKRIDLREAFLSGEMTARQVGIRRMLEGAGARLAAADEASRAAAARLERVSGLRKDGMASAADLREAEHQLVSARAEQRLAAIELELLEEELGE